MRILIIGGGVFVGRAIIEAALGAGHRVTAFSRGNSPLPHPAEIEVITGNRNQDLGLLSERDWDAVIDTCAYRPEEVQALHTAVGSRTGHYTLISSISAYADQAAAGLNEDAVLSPALADPDPGITRENYGPLKAAAESAAVAFDQTLIVRPGIIAGPHDPTDRFTYWVDLVAKQDPLLVPAGLPTAPVQIIDVRDLARWLIGSIETGVTGAYNAVGPQTPITMAQMLEAINQGLGRDVQVKPWSEAALTTAGAKGPGDFPLYLPTDSAQRGLFQVDGRKAWHTGLTHRPVAETARDTAAWFAANHQGSPKVGWAASLMAKAADTDC